MVDYTGLLATATTCGRISLQQVCYLLLSPYYSTLALFYPFSARGAPISSQIREPGITCTICASFVQCHVQHRRIDQTGGTSSSTLNLNHLLDTCVPPASSHNYLLSTCGPVPLLPAVLTCDPEPTALPHQNDTHPPPTTCGQLYEINTLLSIEIWAHSAAAS